MSRANSALLGAGIGALGGAAIGGIAGGPGGAVVGALGGAAVGGLIGYGAGHNPTVIFNGQPYVIVIKHRQDQPEFHDLHNRNVNFDQLTNLDRFFSKFHNDRSASDIRYCVTNHEYYYECPDKGVEYAFNIDTLEYKEYRMDNGNMKSCDYVKYSPHARYPQSAMVKSTR